VALRCRIIPVLPVSEEETFSQLRIFPSGKSIHLQPYGHLTITFSKQKTFLILNSQKNLSNTRYSRRWAYAFMDKHAKEERHFTT